jgi:two-component system aerobic respiration control sensor histidine kinase ArcB
MQLKYLNQVLMLIPGNVYWKDKKGRYLGCNKQQLEIAKVKRIEDVIGKTDRDLYSEEIAVNIMQTDKEIIESREEKTLEEKGVDEFGKESIYLTKKSPLYDELGQVVGLVGIGVDITERKRAEEALRIAKEQAEAASQAKTEFIENMRHDIRTPLTGIVGCAHLLQMKPNDPQKVVEYADDLVESSDALMDFLNRILESITVASGEMLVVKKRFNLKKSLDQIIHLNRAQAAVKGVELIFEYDKTIPVLVGDEVRVQRIVLELLTNALKYTDSGEIKVGIRLIKKKKREVIIELRVSDTGIGIPKNKQSEIYTRFTRLTPSSQGIYPGTGLGLSVVKQFIDDLQGEIHVESDLGEGSTFICLIPFQKSLLDGSETFEGEIASETFRKSRGEKELSVVPSVEAHGSRVLVVEDNTIAAKVAGNVLSEKGCEVDIAGNGKTALEKVEKNHYDLVLMDVGLPDEDGCEVTRRIRVKQWKKNPSLPIIGLTAHVEADKKQRCLTNGMNAVYSKPLTSEKLIEILNVFLPSQIGEEAVVVEQSSSALDSEAVLDLVYAEKLVGDKAFVKECLGLLIKGLDTDVKALKQHRKVNDWPSIKDLAHKWRGGASYCGANRLIQACQQLESALGNEPIAVEKAELLYKQLLRVIKVTQQAAKKAIAVE